MAFDLQAPQFPWQAWMERQRQKQGAWQNLGQALGNAGGGIISAQIKGQQQQRQAQDLESKLPEQLKPFAAYIAKDPSLLRQLYPAATRQGKGGVTLEQNPDGSWAISSEPNQTPTGTSPGVPQSPATPPGAPPQQPPMTPAMPPPGQPPMTPMGPPPGGSPPPQMPPPAQNNQQRQRISNVSPNTAAGIISRQKKDPGNIDWASASPQDKELGRGLYEGRIQTSALSWRDRSVGTKLAISYAMSNGLSPYVSYLSDTRAKGANYFATGKGGQNAISLDTALKHMGTLHDAYQTLGNLDQRFMNVPINKIGALTNDPKIVSTLAAMTAVENEVATAFKTGTATNQEISAWREAMNPNLTPKQQMGLLNTLDELLRGRLSGLENARKNIMTKSIAQRQFLSPESQAVSKKIQTESAQGKQGGIADGTTKTLNGKTYRKVNGQWLEQ